MPNCTQLYITVYKLYIVVLYCTTMYAIIHFCIKLHPVVHHYTTLHANEANCTLAYPDI